MAMMLMELQDLATLEGYDVDGGQAARHRDEAAAAGQQQKGHCPWVYTQPHLSAQGPGPAHHSPALPTGRHPITPLITQAASASCCHSFPQ